MPNTTQTLRLCEHDLKLYLTQKALFWAVARFMAHGAAAPVLFAVLLACVGSPFTAMLSAATLLDCAPNGGHCGWQSVLLAVP